MLRDIYRDILSEHIAEPPEELVFSLVSAAINAFKDEKSAKRIGAEGSMQVGLNKVELIKSACYNRFKMNYPWDTKNGNDMLEFLSTRPENETIDKFADFWWSNDFHRLKKGAPSLQEIYQNWPAAFSAPEYKSDNSKPKIFRAGEQT